MATTKERYDSAMDAVEGRRGCVQCDGEASDCDRCEAIFTYVTELEEKVARYAADVPQARWDTAGDSRENSFTLANPPKCCDEDMIRCGPDGLAVMGGFFWSCTGAKSGTKHDGAFLWCFDDDPYGPEVKNDYTLANPPQCCGEDMLRCGVHGVSAMGQLFWSCNGAKVGTKHDGAFLWCFDDTPAPAGGGGFT